MEAFWAIAQANPSPADLHPSRNSGEPGYKASADYVANLMKEWGYNVTIQTYKFDYYAYTGTPLFSELSPTSHDYTLLEEWNAGQSLGTATADLQPAGGIIIPPTATPSSSSGCTAGDFSAFVPGRIALIQRGTCNFGVKVQNAQAAGATGVIIFNEGNPTPPGRIGVLGGIFLDANDNPFVPTIPVAFTSFAIGADLLTQYQNAVQAGTALPVMSINIEALYQPNADDYNVIAESKGGDKNHVLVDRRTPGCDLRSWNARQRIRFRHDPRGRSDDEERRPGEQAALHLVRRRGAGSPGFLVLHQQSDLERTQPHRLRPRRRCHGDAQLRRRSSRSRRARPVQWHVYLTFPNRVYKASTVARDQAINYFNSIGLNHELFSPVGTDAFNFNLVGIPASGLLTGQDCCKTQGEVDLFGGFVGNFEGNVPSFDGGCVDNPFRWCDNLDNNDPEVLTFMSKAFATMTVQMAFDTKIMSASNNTVINKKLPIAAEVGRHTMAK